MPKTYHEKQLEREHRQMIYLVILTVFAAVSAAFICYTQDRIEFKHRTVRMEQHYDPSKL